MVGSLDVRALYPSLDQMEAAEMVSQLVLRSNVKVTGVDFRAAQVFLVSNLDETMVKQEGLGGPVANKDAQEGEETRAHNGRVVHEDFCDWWEWWPR